MDEKHVIITLIGNVDDLYADNGFIKQTRIFSDDTRDDYNFDVTITSYDETLKHELFNSICGKKIRIVIETEDE